MTTYLSQALLTFVDACRRIRPHMPPSADAVKRWARVGVVVKTVDGRKVRVRLETVKATRGRLVTEQACDSFMVALQGGADVAGVPAGAGRRSAPKPLLAPADVLAGRAPSEIHRGRTRGRVVGGVGSIAQEVCHGESRSAKLSASASPAHVARSGPGPQGAGEDVAPALAAGDHPQRGRAGAGAPAESPLGQG